MRNIFPARLTRLPEEDFENRPYLSLGEDIYYFLDYTVGSSFQENEVTSFLQNYKKCPEKYPEGTGARWYKEEAIRMAGGALATITNSHDFVWVPLPPSKPIGHPRYDDRNLRALTELEPPWDVRQLFTQVAEREAQHQSDQRLTPEEIASGWEIDLECIHDPMPCVIFFDDVLTQGSTYRAAVNLFQKNLQALGLPPVRTLGLFLTRAVRPRPEIDFNFDFDRWGA